LLNEKRGCRIIGAGDDDQSIYSWRKAAPEGIRRFLDDYENAIDYPLSVTLRCGKKIIQWANYIIQGDPDRPVDRGVLKPHPSSPDGEIALLSFRGEKSEASGIAKLVQGLINKNGVEPKDILVLIRTDHNGMFSSPIRQEIEKLDIQCTDPSYIYSLLAEEENRYLIELLRLLINPKDSISWASLLHLTKNVGNSFYQHIYEKAKESGKTFAEVLFSDYEEEYSGAPTSANIFRNTMDVILPWLEENELPEKKPNEGWESWIVELAGKDDVLPKPTSEFSELLLKLDKLSEGEQSLERYLGQIEPLGKDLAQAQSEGVRIMTMGGSKGLTVRATIIGGVEDGLVPHPSSDLSEERRILYVAMTRAKEYLFCTWASRRRGPTARAGNSSMNRRLHSHFLNDGPVKSQNGQNFLNQRFK